MPEIVRAALGPQAWTGDDVLRGFGVPVEKSVELLFVSVQQSAARMSAVVFEGAGATCVSEQLVPAP